jgi:hypothetical protein
VEGELRRDQHDLLVRGGDEERVEVDDRRQLRAVGRGHRLRGFDRSLGFGGRQATRALEQLLALVERGLLLGREQLVADQTFDRRRKIRAAGLEGRRRDDLAAARQHRIPEERAQTEAVFVLRVEHREAPSTEGLEGVRHDRLDLFARRRAHAEDLLAPVHEVFLRVEREQRDARGLGLARRGFALVGDEGADDRGDVAVGRELAHGLGRAIPAPRAVANQNPHPGARARGIAAKDTGREQNSLETLLAEAREAPRERQHDAEGPARIRDVGTAKAVEECEPRHSGQGRHCRSRSRLRRPLHALGDSRITRCDRRRERKLPCLLDRVLGEQRVALVERALGSRNPEQPRGDFALEGFGRAQVLVQRQAARDALDLGVDAQFFGLAAALAAQLREPAQLLHGILARIGEHAIGETPFLRLELREAQAFEQRANFSELTLLRREAREAQSRLVRLIGIGIAIEERAVPVLCLARIAALLRELGEAHRRVARERTLGVLREELAQRPRLGVGFGLRARVVVGAALGLVRRGSRCGACERQRKCGKRDARSDRLQMNPVHPPPSGGCAPRLRTACGRSAPAATRVSQRVASRRDPAACRGSSAARAARPRRPPQRTVRANRAGAW